jgi:DNA repair protein RadC
MATSPSPRTRPSAGDRAAHRPPPAAEPSGAHPPAGPPARSALSIRQWPEAERPRERLRALGAQALSAAELLTLLFGSGGRSGSALECARRVLAAADGSLGRLANTPLGALVRQPGVGPARAAAVLASLELGRRFAFEERPVGAPLRSPHDVVAAFAPRLQDLPVEEFHVAILDVQHRLERDVLISRGLLDASLVHPREVFREAIAERAASVVLVHNHPSGDPTPSRDDRAVTRQLVEAGRLLDIPVHDHVIIGRGTYLSFAEAGLL